MRQTNQQPPENSNDGSDEDGGDDDRTKRVNVTVRAGQHKDWQNFAEEHGMNFSRFVRRGCIEVRNRIEGDNAARELQPLLEHTRANQEALERIDESLAELDDRIAELERGSQEKRERVADEMLQLFYDDVSKTIPELIDDLDYSRQEVQRGIKTLEARHVVSRFEPSNPETGVVEFRLRGK